MANVFIDIAAEFTGNKAFKQAETSTEKLTKNVKKLAASFGVAFGTAQVIAFGKAAVKASLEAQAQQERLANLVKVTVGATDAQVQSLNDQAAALQAIGVVNKENITQTQSQLATFNLQIDTIKALTPAILDYVTAEKGAAASADEFKSMTNGLAQALNGNFASLTKVGFVLDDVTKKTIKEGTETERAAALVKVLDSTYKDFNKNLANTPTGQMQKLANAADDARQIIGTGLLDALTSIGEDTSVENLANNMQAVALYVADVTRGIGKLTSALNNIPIIGNFNVGMIPILGTYLEALRGSGKQTGGGGGFPQGPPSDLTALSRSSTVPKEQLKVQKETLKVSKNQLKLAKAKSIFDTQKIQIEAALKGKISEEERIRLLLLRAIGEENIDDIDKYSKLLSEVQGKVTDLQSTLAEVYSMDAGNPFISWEMGLDGVQRALIDIEGQSIQLTNTLAQNSLAMGLAGGASFAQALSGARYAAQAAASMGITGTISGLPPVTPTTPPGGSTTIVDVTVNGTVIAQQDLQQAIQDAVNNNNLAGNERAFGSGFERMVAI